MFRSLKFDLLFLSGAIATFPLYVPPFFLALYCQSIGLKPSVGVAMVASFGFSSAVVRIGLGLLCDFFGPLNMLFVTLLMTGIGMLVLMAFQQLSSASRRFYHMERRRKRRLLRRHAHGCVTDQRMANNGSINYCVRWNTALTFSAANRTKPKAALQRSLSSWVETLVGFEGFPLTEANVGVVGYAVKDRTLLEDDTSGLDVYTTTDADGVPECDTRCYRGAHLDDTQGLASCPGGEESRYDISLWLDDSEVGPAGYGYNWGEEMSPTYFFQTIDDENVHIVLYEMGHGFGLLGEFARFH
jgi:hypothetical protein